MGITITTLDEAIGDSDPKIIIYSDAGVGKTTMAGTLPGRVLILSAEDGLRSLKLFPASERKRINVADVKDTDDLKDAYSKLQSGAIKYDWVVVDSISEIAEMMLRDAKKKNKDARQSYTKTEDHVVEMLTDFRGLSCGVLFIAKEHAIKRQIGETEVDYYNLFLPGQRLTTNVPHLVDNVWRLIAKGEKRYIITKADGRSRAKSRDGLDAMIDVSDGLGAVVEMMRAPPDKE